MQIRLKLMGMLKPKTPPDGCLELADDATIKTVMDALQIPHDSVQVFSVNGELERNRDRILLDQDEVSLIPPVGGGD